MEKKGINRRFSTREMVICWILIVVLFLGLYFGLVYYPLNSRSAEVDKQLESVQSTINVEKLRKAEYDMMNAEIERVKEDGDTTVMPPYDNNKQQEALNALFVAALAGTDNWSVSFGGEPRLQDGVRIRTVAFSYTVNAVEGSTVFEQAREVLSALMTTGFRCALTDLTLVPSGDGDAEGADALGVNCTIVFYELDQAA